MRKTRTCANAFSNLCALALVLCAASSARAQHDHSQHMREQQAQQAAAQTREGFTRTVASYDVPDVSLVDMNGARVCLGSVLKYDGPVLLQFIVTTCPTICPVMSGTFSAAQERLGAGAARARMVSISIDPEQDTPERLREYARKFKAGQPGAWSG